MFYIQESTFELAAKQNHNLLSPTLRPQIRDTIYAHIEDMDVSTYFDTVMKTPNRMADRIKGILPMRIKLILKTIKLWLQF